MKPANVALKPSSKPSHLEIVSAATPFAYEDLGDVAAEARAAARRIHKHIRATKVSIFEIGKELRAVKGQLKHGQFGNWITAEFGMSDRTAQRYMAVAERFDGKQDLLKALPIRVIYALSAPSTPAGFTEMKLLEIEDGNIPLEGEVALEIAAAKKDIAGPKPTKLKKAAKALSAEQAAEKAVAMVRKRLGASFPKFIELVAQAGIHHFMLALDQAVAGDAG